MGFIKEFKEFAMRSGNVMDMAVGVVVGGAFGKIVTSLVNNIIMPPIGVLLGGIDFSDFFIPLSTQHVGVWPKEGCRYSRHCLWCFPEYGTGIPHHRIFYFYCHPAAEPSVAKTGTGSRTPPVSVLPSAYC